jgi:DNA-binding SARP family transcriptional activator/predicted ATPase
MRFRDLGTLEFGGESSSRSLGRRGSVVLAMLLWSDRPVSPDRLIDVVWNEQQPADPRESLHVLIWRLRRVLEPDRTGGVPPSLLVMTPAGYMLLARDEQVDSKLFARLCGESRTAVQNGDALLALEKIDAALDLWRGHPLGDLGYESWARATATRFIEMKLNAHELRLEALSCLGRDDAVVAETEELVVEHPTREVLWARRARALYRIGDQGAALRVVHAARRYLAEELGVSPGPQLIELERQILSHDPTLMRPAFGADSGRPTVYPTSASLRRPLSSYLGRGSETAFVGDLIASQRLVTVTGPGGVGKTRLALEVANVRSPGFDHGAVLVDLSVPNSTEDSLHLIASRGQLRANGVGADDVRVSLCTAHLLVVLDSCEQSPDTACSLVATLSCFEGVTVLATSRCPLGADGERLVALRTLGSPAADARARDVAQHPAVQLLAQRAIAAGRPADIASDELTELIELSTLLDGLPLALELAGSALGTLDAAHIIRCLRAGGDLPAAPGAARPPRHRSLDALFQPSIYSCDSAARELLERLALIEGPFDLFAAEAIGAGQGRTETDVARGLSALVHASLVTFEGSGNHTYRIIQPIRAAIRRAAPSGRSTEKARRRTQDELTPSYG